MKKRVRKNKMERECKHKNKQIRSSDYGNGYTIVCLDYGEILEINGIRIKD